MSNINRIGNIVKLIVFLCVVSVVTNGKDVLNLQFKSWLIEFGYFDVWFR